MLLGSCECLIPHGNGWLVQLAHWLWNTNNQFLVELKNQQRCTRWIFIYMHFMHAPKHFFIMMIYEITPFDDLLILNYEKQNDIL